MTIAAPLRKIFHLSPQRIVAMAILVAGIVVGLVAFVVWTDLDVAASALRNQRATEADAKRQTDLLTAHIGDLVDQVDALRAQVISRGGTPVVQAPGNRTTRLTTTTQPSTTTTTQPPPSTTTTTQPVRPCVVPVTIRPGRCQ